MRTILYGPDGHSSLVVEVPREEMAISLLIDTAGLLLAQTPTTEAAVRSLLERIVLFLGEDTLRKAFPRLAFKRAPESEAPLKGAEADDSEAR